MAIALRYAARSDLGLGPKARNEDSGYAGPHLLVLADGMGGHAAGDVASSMIVGHLAPLDGESIGADAALPALERSLREANERLLSAMRADPGLAGMGSTTIAMLRTGNKLAMAHIGDSRAFLLRDGTFSQITKDHSFVQQLVDDERITADEALDHPQRSLVTRVMTGQPDDEPDLSVRELKVGDRYLLCSDGLSDFVRSEVIQEILEHADSAAAAAERCIEVALKASARDNVTVVVADVVDLAQPPSTVPEVVGAAALRDREGNRTKGLPVSPAEKAARLTREVRRAGASDAGESGDPSGASASGASGPDDEVVDLALAEEDGPSRRRRVRALAVTTLVVVVLVGAGYAAYAWSQRQLFIGESQGKVAVYQGVTQDLGPVSLSHVDRLTGIEMASLPTHIQDLVSARIIVADEAEADSRLLTLSAESSSCEAQAALGTPCGNLPVATPSATASTTSPRTTASPSTARPSATATSATSATAR